MNTLKATPMMQQWASCKEKAQEAILLFRLGDFYEAFHEDAIQASQALDLTLTKRQDVPMCGIPWHTSETYIDRLLNKGFSVAIAEQVTQESIEPGKGLIERKIMRIITPATAIRSSVIKESENSILATIASINSSYAIACVDLSTALFFLVEAEGEEALIQELQRIKPKEIFHPSYERSPVFEQIFAKITTPKRSIPTWYFDQTQAKNMVQIHFGVTNFSCFGIEEKPVCISAAGAVLRYLKEHLCQPICHLQTLFIRTQQEHMLLDHATTHHLDIFETSASPGYSLYNTLNKTKTPMGARLLRQYIQHPLLSIEPITARQDATAAAISFIQTFPKNYEETNQNLSLIKDLERLILRIQTGYASPKDIVFLSNCLKHIAPLKKNISSITSSPLLEGAIQSLHGFEELIQKIQTTLTDEPPLYISDGNTIRPGVNEELDALRAMHTNSQNYLASYQTKLREETGCKTLKVGFTRAFGYFIEVSRGQASSIPDSFARRQTLTNTERFITEELKTFESTMLTAEKRIEAIETAIFETLKNEVLVHAKRIHENAQAIASIDLFLSMGFLAISNKYVRPTLVSEPVLNIVEGRHAIAEHRCPNFVPNSLSLNASGPSLALLTGPNMAGKSTFIRQTALVVIMAQIGSFIPAKSATIGIVDRVFTRIGASDNLASGQSTFMVEMAETASILHQATAKSLIILDEIGRGTSTYDGISIAWAVCEHLLRFAKENPRTLFATHYYELTEIEKKYSSVINMTVAISEHATGIRFLYTIISGKTNKSYGIHVAKLAGLPKSVIERAEKILFQLEAKKPKTPSIYIQQELFHMEKQTPQEIAAERPCYDFIKQLDLVKLSPIECFMQLAHFKNTLQ